MSEPSVTGDALIGAARQRASSAVNAELTLLYWRVGRRIGQEVLGDERAEYGKQVISSLARRLTAEYGGGWSEQQLRHCLRIAETFPDEQILYAVRRELSWTHIRTLIYVDDPLKRDFYMEMSRLEGWSSRRLRERIDSMLFERSAKYEQEAGEAPLLGIVLCAGKKQEQIELLELDQSGIHVAEYLTVLPPRETLEAKLHQSIAAARKRLENKEVGE